MHLIAPLAAGVAGCENGTFDIVLRGTSTPASYYTDFEGLTAPIVGTAVPLDARGGGTFYVNSLVKVTCKSALGATIREFIAGDASTAVEVRSDSFTGNAYSGGAAAVGNPTTVAAVLDMWNNSAGCEDWKVLIGGVKTNLSAAFSALQGQRRFVVTEYGAVGDGVTLNTSAINACISAANAAGGGVVFFPPGTFLTNTITAFETVSIEGSGTYLTTIRLQTNVPLISGVLPSKLTGFTLNCAVSHTTDYILESSAGAGSQKEISEIDFASHSGFGVRVTAAGAHKVSIIDCVMATTSAEMIIAVAATAEFFVTRCALTCTAATNSTAATFGTTGLVRVSECRFNFAGAVTASVFKAIVAGISTPMLITGCVFEPPPAPSSWTCITGPSTAVDFAESGNALARTASAATSTVRCYAIVTVSGSAQLTVLGSRTQLSAEASAPNADPILIPSNQAGTVRIGNTSAGSHSGNVQIHSEGSSGAAGAPSIPIGSTLVLHVRNTTGGIVTYEWGTGFANAGGTFTVANNTARSFLFVVADHPTAGKSWTQVADAAGAQV